MYATVFVFDPDGRGDEVIRKFSTAAQLTNSIIIAPNIKMKDSLPQALNDNAVFVDEMLNKWPINEEQLIFAGRATSGLMVTTSAQLSGTLLGVIAVDDAFINIKYTRKNKKTRYKLLLSDESENYYKMRQLDFELRLESAYEGLTIYDPTDDEWPESGYITAALTELLLPITNNLEQRKVYYQEDLSWGETLYNRSRFLNAFEFVNDLKSKYKNKIDDDAAQKELLKKIRSNNGFKVMRNRRLILRERESLLLDDFIFYLVEDIHNSYFDNLGWWNSQMGDLDAKIDSTAINPLERKAAKRLRGYVKNSLEGKWITIRNDPKAKFEQKLFVNVLRTLVDTKNYDAYVLTISFSTREGDDNAALFYLEELLKNGFTDLDALYTIDGTSALRISKEYNAIIKQYLGQSKYY